MTSTPGGDAAVGRSLLLVKPHSVESAALPPHFTREFAQQLYTLLPGCQDMDSFWGFVFPAYAEMPTCMRHCLPFWLASMVHHRAYVRRVAPPNGVILSTPLFTSGLVDRLAPRVLLGHFENPESGLVATGFSPQAEHMKLLCDLKAQLEESTRLAAQQTQQIIAVVAEIPEKTQASVLEVLQDAAVKQLTPDDLQAALNAHTAALVGQLRHILQAGSGGGLGGQAAPPTVPTQQLRAGNPVAFMWGGSFHRVPQGYRLNQASLQSMASVYYWGDEAAGVGPLRHVEACDFTERCDKILLGRTHFVFDFFPKPRDGESLVNGLAPLMAAIEETMKQVYVTLNEQRPKKSKVPGRILEVSVYTAYDRIKESQARDEDDDEHAPRRRKRRAGRGIAGADGDVRGATDAAGEDQHGAGRGGQVQYYFIVSFLMVVFVLLFTFAHCCSGQRRSKSSAISPRYRRRVAAATKSALHLPCGRCQERLV